MLYEKDLMIVGESPSHTRPDGMEDVPFSGRTSYVLWDELAKYGIAREDCFVTNVINKQLPKGQKPTREDIDAGINRLSGEIGVVRPLLILCLGKLAASEVIGYPIEITKRSGTLYQSEVFKYFAMPIIHPAATVRNKGLKQKFVDSIFVGISSLKTIKEEFYKSR